MAATLKQLRRQIAAMLNDIRIVSAKAAGSTTTFINTVELTDADNAYRACQLKFTIGAAGLLGSVRRVTGSSQSTGVLTFTPAVTSATQIGDEIELVNLRGVGYRFQDYDQEINNAIRMLADETFNHAVSATSVWDAASPSVAIPATFTHVYRVEWKDENGFQHVVNPAMGPGYDAAGWWADRALDTVTIMGAERVWADGKDVRLFGLTAPSELVLDTDTTNIRVDWLAAQVAYTMAMKKRDMEMRDAAPVWREDAARLRPLVKTAVPPNAVKVRFS